MQNILCLFLLIFFTTLTNVYSQDVPFKVEASFDEHSLESAGGEQTKSLVSDDFYVKARIINVSNEVQEFEIWSCGDMHWQTDSSLITRGPSVCRENVPNKITLKPGESHQDYVRLDVSKSLVAGLHSFRLGFISNDTKIWSEPVIILCIVRDNVKSDIPTK